MNVLVFPGGNEVGLEVWRGLRFAKGVRPVAAGAPTPTPASSLFGGYAELPLVSDPEWVDALSHLCAQEEIGMIYPTHDRVIDAISASRSILPCDVLLPSAGVVALARSKTQTYAALSGLIATPHISPLNVEDDAFPLVVKPDAGFGSQGVRVVSSREELHSATVVENPVVSEYLPGPEFTVDCFSDRHGEVLFAAARQRNRIRMGTALSLIEAPSPVAGELESWASRIQSVLAMRGGWFFQAKLRADGTPVLMDIGVRPAGSSSAARARGANLPLLTVLDRQNIDLEVFDHRALVEPWSGERYLGSRFRSFPAPEVIYVDLDDTLLIDGAVNVALLAFLFQNANEGSRLVLVTKSLETDLSAYLARHRLGGIFDSVVHLAEDDAKSDAITTTDAMFIDDSFTQRREVHQRWGIPVLDPSMLDGFLSL